MAVEIALLKAARPDLDPSTEGLLRRIERLEKALAGGGDGVGGASGAGGLSRGEGGAAGEDVWPLVVHDVSVGGVGILLARRFEPNTVLSIELASSQSEPPKRFRCKVVRVQPEGAGHWVHGCTVLNPMSKDDVTNLLNFA